MQANTLERRLFYIPSFKIYGSVAGFYDYGPPGCAIKQNLTQVGAAGLGRRCKAGGQGSPRVLSVQYPPCCLASDCACRWGMQRWGIGLRAQRQGKELNGGAPPGKGRQRLETSPQHLCPHPLCLERLHPPPGETAVAMLVEGQGWQHRCSSLLVNAQAWCLTLLQLRADLNPLWTCQDPDIRSSRSFLQCEPGIAVVLSKSI